MRCYCTPTRMGKMKENGNDQLFVKMKNNKNYPASLAGRGEYKLVQILWKTETHLPKLNIGLSYNPAIQLPKDTYVNVYSGLIANSQKLEVIVKSKHWGHLGSCVEAKLEMERQKTERAGGGCGMSPSRKWWWQH